MEKKFIQQQINELYHLYNKDIFQYIYFLTRDREQSKDLMQETFLRAYKNYSSFRDENSKGWLFYIARNITIDTMRRKKPISYLLDIIPAISSVYDTPDQVASFNETEHELYMALGKIKRSYRDVIILRKIEEFSIKETSQILGWSESKIKSNLLRGLKALKKELEKEVDQHEAI